MKEISSSKKNYFHIYFHPTPGEDSLNFLERFKSVLNLNFSEHFWNWGLQTLSNVYNLNRNIKKKSVSMQFLLFCEVRFSCLLLWVMLIDRNL